MERKEQRMAPIFEKYTIEEIARRTRLAETYVSQLKGKRHISKRFRDVACIAFNQSESELFGDEQAA